MNTKSKCPTWTQALLLGLAALAPSAQALPYLDGVVAYDYYVSGVDADGFEWVDADFYAEAVVNDSPSQSGPLSLAGWLTRDRNATGAGFEAGYLPVSTLPGYSEAEVSDTVAADDARPGEYYVNMLLQDDRYPGTWEDRRSLPPTLLWRGGLEAIGPLRLYQYQSGWLDVDFDRLDNRRLDGRYTNGIVLRLVATYGFGPASEGFVLCEKTVPGLYAGDTRLAPGFRCYPKAAPDGEFTLHLEVAEAGGRGGYSTLTGPDAYFRGGWVQRFYGCSECFADAPGGYDVVYYSGSLGLASLLPLMLLALGRTRRALRDVLAALVLLPLAAVAAPAHADFSDAELDQMLAPIALYPDSVLSNVLIAATYPLEVAQAARWSRQNPDLDAELALEAVADRDWDDSVKALVAFPEILARMDEDLEWTRDLGEAFLAQDDDVMDRVQALRRRADDSGHLAQAEHVQVVREREVIYIEPAVSRRIYIPYYDPWVVYGNWWWPAYPPHCWSFWAGHPVAYYGRYHAPFYWGSWVAVSAGFYFTAFDWHRHHVVFVPRHHHRHVHYGSRHIIRYEGARHWRHDAHHRRDVEYRHQRLSHRSDGHREQRRETVERGNYRERAARPAEHARARHADRRAPEDRREGRSRADRARAPSGDMPEKRGQSHSAPPPEARSQDRERRGNRIEPRSAPREEYEGPERRTPGQSRQHSRDQDPPEAADARSRPERSHRDRGDRRHEDRRHESRGGRERGSERRESGR